MNPLPSSPGSAGSVPMELLRRYDRPVPRYTSYPTAAEFHDGVGLDAYRAALAQPAAVADPVALYVHLPFCRERCHFCGCHVVVGRRAPETATSYLQWLEREADLVVQAMGGPVRASQLHWGGGTPTFYDPEQLAHLHRTLTARFPLTHGAEQAVEVDPRVTRDEHLSLLRELGFNRLSLGVQDFDPEVQRLIGRGQSYEETERLYRQARGLGFASVNLDLVYGLPGQDEASFRATLRRVTALRPDRVAVYSYAHVPWLRPNQRRIPEDALPEPERKLRLLLMARESFGEAGYAIIGMDHFALPEDELAQAWRAGTLHRNFMGYTVQKACTLLGLGITAIGEVGGNYFQNTRKLSTYRRDLAQGRLPVERGFLVSRDDRIRRAVIQALMCRFGVNRAEVERAFGIVFEDYFREELETLWAPGGVAEDGFVETTADGLRLTPLGEVFVRNVAVIFDRYRKQPSPRSSRFSRAI